MADARVVDLARARLEYLNAGRPALGTGPRRADEEDWLAEPWLLDELGPEPVEVADGTHRGGAAPTNQPDGEPSLASTAVAFGRQHLRALGVVALALCLVVSVFVLRAGSSTVPLQPVALASGQVSAPPVATPSPQASAPVSASPVPIRVHVLGAVRRPGVVRLPAGARVTDAMAAAGGQLSNADPGELNLAAPLLDGDQVVVGTRQRPRGEVRHPGQGAGATTDGSGAAAAGTTAGGTSAGGSGTGSAKVNLNTATAQQLDSLPGVGPVTAQHILDWREEHQRFSRVEELQEVDGIGPKTFANLKDHVVV